MLKKYLFILIAFAALCAWGIAPNWSDASARSLNQSIPIPEDPTNAPDSPANPDAPFPADGPNGVTGPPTGDGNIAVGIRPATPTFVRGGVFRFIARAFNIGRQALRSVTIRFVVPAFTFFGGNVQSADVGDFTCQNDGEAGDVCAYEAGDIEPGETVEFEIPLTIREDYPDNGVEPLTLHARVDGQNDEDGVFNTNRTSGTALDEIASLNDESVPETSDTVMLSSPEPDDEAAPQATVDEESGTVSIPVGFENTSDVPLDNVVLTAQLPEGATIPDGSPWSCDENGTCVQNVGTIAPGEALSAPFVFIGNNITEGTPVEVPTRLDAQQIAADGTVTPVNLRGTVAVTVEAPSTPLALDETEEPAQERMIFLPLVQN